MEICKDKTFEAIMNEKVFSYLREIKTEFIIYENEVIHCINDECTKKYIDFNLYLFFSNNIIDITENFIIEKDKIEQNEKERFSLRLRHIYYYLKFNLK